MRKLLMAAIAGLFLSVGTQPSFAQEPNKCVTYEQGRANVAEGAKRSGLDIVSMHLTAVQTEAVYEAGKAIGLIAGDPNGIPAERIAILIERGKPEAALFFYDAKGCLWSNSRLPIQVFIVLMDMAFTPDDMPMLTPVRIEIAV